MPAASSNHEFSCIRSGWAAQVSPVPVEETMELYAFMTAAEESKSRGGVPVSIAETLAKAKRLAQLIIDDQWCAPASCLCGPLALAALLRRHLAARASLA